MSLYWDNDAIYDRESDFTYKGFEACWFQNTTDEWKWSWYGLVEVNESKSNAWHVLRIENGEEPQDVKKHPLWTNTRPGLPEWYMEVDNILITDDPNCVPTGKGTENKEDYTIGYTTSQTYDSTSEPDFYVKTKIAGTTHQSDTWWNDYNVPEDWPATVNVPDNDVEVPITIELWEDDGTDDLCDINPHPNYKKCNITYNLKNGTWHGDDHIADTDFVGRTCGEVDGNDWELDANELDANIYFEVSQNDYDDDGITYWQEVLGPYDGSISPKIKNDRYAVMVAGGASCKLKQDNNIGSVFPFKGTYFRYEHGYSWTDYTVYVDVMTNELISDPPTIFEEIGVMFRYQDSNNYYILRWEENGNNDRMFLKAMVNGVCENVADPVYTDLEKGAWYTLKIVLNGDHIEVWKNKNIEGGGQSPWYLIFSVTNNSLSSGSITLFCWKNQEAWFDDVLVKNGEDVLLSEGFDYGKKYGWTVVDEVVGGSSNWHLTERSVDQEEFYIGPDFVYRTLRIVAHYDENHIHYLSADKWRDADGDGENDINRLSSKDNIQYELENWISQASDSNDLNLMYIFDHGYQPYSSDYCYFMVDDNRNGKLDDPVDKIWDYDISSWLPYYGNGGIGRLTFIIEACYIGHFIDNLSKPNENRTIIVTSEEDNVAEPETGQDQAAFHFLLFKKMADGETDLASAFNVADYHVDKENFFSIWIPPFYEDALYPPENPQDAELDDNGDYEGHDYNLPNNGDGYLAGRTGL